MASNLQPGAEKGVKWREFLAGKGDRRFSLLSDSLVNELAALSDRDREKRLDQMDARWNDQLGPKLNDMLFEAEHARHDAANLMMKTKSFKTGTKSADELEADRKCRMVYQKLFAGIRESFLFAVEREFLICTGFSLSSDPEYELAVYRNLIYKVWRASDEGCMPEEDLVSDAYCSFMDGPSRMDAISKATGLFASFGKDKKLEAVRRDMHAALPSIQEERDIYGGMLEVIPLLRKLEDRTSGALSDAEAVLETICDRFERSMDRLITR